MRKEKAIREIVKEGDVRKKSEDVREYVDTLARIVIICFLTPQQKKVSAMIRMQTHCE